MLYYITVCFSGHVVDIVSTLTEYMFHYKESMYTFLVFIVSFFVFLNLSNSELNLNIVVHTAYGENVFKCAMFFSYRPSLPENMRSHKHSEIDREWGYRKESWQSELKQSWFISKPHDSVQGFCSEEENHYYFRLDFRRERLFSLSVVSNHTLALSSTCECTEY